MSEALHAAATNGTSDNDETSALAAFALIQMRRRIAGPSPPLSSSSGLGIAFCPSMDLLVLRGSLYRTLQAGPRLAVLPKQDDTEDNEDADKADPSTDALHSWPVAWRSDGRWLAWTPDRFSLSIVALEDLLASTPESLNPVNVTSQPLSSPLLHLSWHQVSTGHWQWNKTSRSSHSHSMTLRKQSLPPSEYHITPVELPSLTTPLSILVAASLNGQVYLYIHGRTPLVVTQPGFIQTTQKPLWTLSPNASHLIVSYTQTTSRLIIHSWPRLGRHTSVWRTWTSLYTSLQHSIQTITHSTTSLQSTSASALTSLDRKLDPLVNLLKNYQVCQIQSSAGSILRQALAHAWQSTRASSLAIDGRALENALDQFFTSVGMNE
jgi:hypothetical protein